MASFADHPQLKPSGQDRTVRQRQHERELRNHSVGITYRVLEYHQHHNGFENTQIEIADAVDCSDTTISDLIKEYVEKGLNSAIGLVALNYGFQVSKRNMGSYWRLSVEPYQVKPIYLDPEAYAEVEYTYSDNDQMIENPEESFTKFKEAVKKDRPSLTGLSDDQGQDANATYGGWVDSDGGEE